MWILYIVAMGVKTASGFVRDIVIGYSPCANFPLSSAAVAGYAAH
jgi:hypothetical protein